jgi:hypothetical protein
MYVEEIIELGLTCVDARRRMVLFALVSSVEGFRCCDTGQPFILGITSVVPIFLPHIDVNAVQT